MLDPRMARQADTFRRHGIKSICAWMSRYPNEAHRQLGRRLGVMPVELLYWQFQEAKRSGMLAWAYVDSFVRVVRDCLPEGWGAGGDVTDRDRLMCQVAWKRRVAIGLGVSEVPIEADEFWKAIEQQAPSVGWVPQGIDDDIVLKAAEAVFSQGTKQDKEQSEIED